MTSAVQAGDTAGANAAQRELAQEMRTRTQLHRVGEALPSYEKGGKVKKTGLAIVHKGEKVVPEKKSKSRAGAAMSGEDKAKSKPKKAAKKKSRKVHRMEIKRAANGGYIATHHFKQEPGEVGPAPESEDNALSDMNQLHDHLDEHMGPEDEAAEGPQPPEEEAGEPGEGAPAGPPPQGM